MRSKPLSVRITERRAREHARIMRAIEAAHRVYPVILLCLVLAGCGDSIAGYRDDEKRDFRIKGAEMDIIRTDDRLQKQINELRERVEQLEQRK